MVTSRFLSLPALALGLCLSVSALFGANYVDDSLVDPLDLLPEPPASGSTESAADLENVVRVHAEASADAIAEGKAENHLTIFAFASVVGGSLEPGKLPKLEALIARAEADTRELTTIAKRHWERPRPCAVAPDRIKDPIEPDDVKSYSYPSGHSTRGTVFALILAELFPGSREAILAEGREAGFLRVQGGMHYASDIYAGRVLGQAIVRAMLKQPAFQKDLDEVAEEIAQVLGKKAA